MRYQVETYFLGDFWENVWYDEGERLTFASYTEAVEELIDHLAATIRAHRAGDMSEPIALDNYRIVPCEEHDLDAPHILPEDFAV